MMLEPFLRDECESKQEPLFEKIDAPHDESINTSDSKSNDESDDESTSESPTEIIDEPRDFIKARWPGTNIPRFITWPILSTYFFLGIAQALPVTSVSWVMIYDANLTPAAINLTYNLWFQSGLARPLWGILSDQFPIRGKRRVPYLIGAAVFCALFTGLMGFETTCPSAGIFIAWGLMINLTWSIAESMTDTLAIECTTDLIGAAITHLGLEQENERVQQERRHEYGIAAPDQTEVEHSQQAGTQSKIRKRNQSSTQSNQQPTNQTNNLSSYSSMFGLSPAAPISRVDRLTTLMKARMQSECMSVRTCSTIVAYAVSIVLLKFLDYRTVIALNVLSFIPAIFAALAVREKSVKTSFFGMSSVHADGTIADTDSDDDEHLPRASSFDEPTPRTKGGFLRAKLKQLYIAARIAFGPLLFTFLYYAVPSSLDTWYYFLYSGSFSFEPWQADLFSFLSLIASLMGTLFYGRFLSHLSCKRMFVVCTCLGFGVEIMKIALAENLVQSWMSPVWYVPMSSCIGSFIGGIGNMVPIVLAHSYSPRLVGMEGAMFSVFQTADRVGVIVSSSLAALMSDRLDLGMGSFRLLWLFILICALLEFLPLFTMPLLLKRRPPPDTIANTKKEQVELEPQRT